MAGKLDMSRGTILGLAIATGPLVWLLSFGADFALSGWTCGAHSRLPFFVISAAGVLLTALAMALSWHEWVAIGKEWPGESAGEVARRRSVAIGGIGINALFILVLIAQSIPILMLRGCE